MRTDLALTLVATMCVAVASPAAAQRYTFEQSVPVTADSRLDVVTDRGKVDVRAGAVDAVEVVGTVTVRAGWDVPADAVALAQAVARRPPIAVNGARIALFDPADARERRAVTVSYVVRVPARLPVSVRSQSGAVHVEGVRAPVVLVTQSSAIDAEDVGTATITSGSGAVRVSGAGGDVAVDTRSSAIEIDGAGGGVRARTGSGSVRVGLVAAGRVDIETSSSAIDVRGAQGALTVRSGSGSVRIAGAPSGEWAVSTRSSSIDVTVPRDASLQLMAATRSGGVTARGLASTTVSTAREVAGAMGQTGPAVRLDSRSGSIRLATSDRS